MLILELFKDIIQFVRALDKNILPASPLDFSNLGAVPCQNHSPYHRAKVRAQP